jgi:glycosyltransferase involved in cell wall biosynthesis
MTRGRRQGVICVGQLPPPVHGASVVTGEVLRLLSVEGPVLALDMSCDSSGPISYHLQRLLAHLVGAAKIVRHGSDFGAMYVSLPAGLALLYQLPILLAARLYSLPIYLHHHSFAYADDRRRTFWLVAVASGNNATHIVLCNCHGEKLSDRYSQVRRQMICGNSWVQQNISKSAEVRIDRPTPEIVLGHLSNLTEQKGVGRAAAVFAALVERGVPVRIEIAGPTTDSFAAALIQDLEKKWPDKVSYHGPLYGNDKQRFYCALDIFLFPSDYPNEAAPVVVDEALAGGAIVLSSRRGCLVEGQVRNVHETFAMDGIVESMTNWILTWEKLGGRAAVMMEASRRQAAAQVQLTKMVAKVAGRPLEIAASAS